MPDYKVSVDVDVNDSKLDKVKRTIDTLTDNSHKIELDVKVNGDFAKTINSISKALGNIDDGKVDSITKSLSEATNQLTEFVTLYKKGLSGSNISSAVEKEVKSVEKSVASASNTMVSQAKKARELTIKEYEKMLADYEKAAIDETGQEKVEDALALIRGKNGKFAYRMYQNLDDAKTEEEVYAATKRLVEAYEMPGPQKYKKVAAVTEKYSRSAKEQAAEVKTANETVKQSNNEVAQSSQTTSSTVTQNAQEEAAAVVSSNEKIAASNEKVSQSFREVVNAVNSIDISNMNQVSVGFDNAAKAIGDILVGLQKASMALNEFGSGSGINVQPLISEINRLNNELLETANLANKIKLGGAVDSDVLVKSGIDTTPDKAVIDDAASSLSSETRRAEKEVQNLSNENVDGLASSMSKAANETRQLGDEAKEAELKVESLGNADAVIANTLLSQSEYKKEGTKKLRERSALQLENLAADLEEAVLKDAGYYRSDEDGWFVDEEAFRDYESTLKKRRSEAVGTDDYYRVSKENHPGQRDALDALVELRGQRFAKSIKGAKETFESRMSGDYYSEEELRKAAIDYISSQFFNKKVSGGTEVQKVLRGGSLDLDSVSSSVALEQVSLSATASGMQEAANKVESAASELKTANMTARQKADATLNGLATYFKDTATDQREAMSQLLGRAGYNEKVSEGMLGAYDNYVSNPNDDNADTLVNQIKNAASAAKIDMSELMAIDTSPISNAAQNVEEGAAKIDASTDKIEQSFSEARTELSQDIKVEEPKIEADSFDKAAEKVEENAKEIDSSAEKTNQSIDEIRSALSQNIKVDLDLTGLNELIQKLDSVIAKINEVVSAMNKLSSSDIANIGTALSTADNNAEQLASGSKEVKSELNAAGNEAGQLADNVGKAASAMNVASGESRGIDIPSSTSEDYIKEIERRNIERAKQFGIDDTEILTRRKNQTKYALDNLDGYEDLLTAIAGGNKTLAPIAHNVDSLFRQIANADAAISKLDPIKDKELIASRKAFRDQLKTELFGTVDENGETDYSTGLLYRAINNPDSGIGEKEKTRLHRMVVQAEQRVKDNEARWQDKHRNTMVNEDYRELNGLLNEIAKKEADLSKARQTGKSSDYVDSLRSQIDGMYKDAETLWDRSFKEFSPKQQRVLEANSRKNDRKIASADSKAYDKQTENYIKHLERSAKKLNQAKMKMIGLDKDSDEYKELEKIAAYAQKNVDKYKGKLNGRWSDEQRLKFNETQKDLDDKLAIKRGKYDDDQQERQVKRLIDLEKELADVRARAIKAKDDTPAYEQAQREIAAKEKELADQKYLLGITDKNGNIEGNGRGLLTNKQWDRWQKSKEDSSIKIDRAQSDKDTKEIEANFDKLIKKTKELNGYRIKMIGLDETSNEFKELSAAADKAEKEVVELKAKLDGKMTIKQSDDYAALQQDLKDEYDIRSGRYTDDQQERQLKNLIALEKEAYNLRKKRVNASGEELSDIERRLTETKQRIFEKENLLGLNSEEIARAVEDPSLFKTLNKGMLTDEQFDRYTTELYDMASALNTVEAAYRDAQRVMRQKLTTGVESLKASFDVWETENTKAMKMSKWASQMQGFRYRLSTASDLDQLKQINKEFDIFKKNVKAAGDAGLSVGDRLKVKMKEYASYAAASMGIMEIIQGLKQMAQEVLTVDTAMTELRRVTDLTAEGYDNLYDKMSEAARKNGQILSDSISATADWVRAGFDADVSVKLAEKTAMYQNVSDLGYDEAAENLLTSYNGFKQQFLENYGGDEAAAVEHIVDVLNELDNNFSVTSAGLGEGLARSASALQMAGNTFEQSAAMIGAVTEVTQDPEKAGNAMKILSLRLRGMKGELEELGEETDENVENISKMQGQILNLTRGEVNIFDGSGEFRSTYDIMTDIAEVYDKLSTTEQADLLETIAGKHRANDVAALIQNIGNAAAMEESAMNSAGSASEENAKQVESLQGRINQLMTAWQELANEFMSSDLLKGLVSGLTTVLDFVTNIMDMFGGLPSLLGVIAGALTFTDFKDALPFYTVDAKDDENKLSGKNVRFGIAERFSSLRGGGEFSLPEEFGETLQKDTAYLNSYKNALINGSGYQDAFNDVMSHGSETAKQYAQELKDLYTETKQQYGNQADGIDAAKKKVKEISNDDVEKELNKRATLDYISGQASDKTLENKKNLIKGYNEEYKKLGVTQKEFAGAVGKTDTLFGRYLTRLNGAKASMAGYASFALRAKAATLALNTVMMAGNMLLTMAVSAGISFAISKLSDLIVTEKELKEKVDEVTKAYDEQRETIKNAKTLVDKVAPSDGSYSRYQELSKGVNELGQNINLTNSEYEEYQSIVSDIANTFPELVKGYDSEGNAILACKNNVDALTEAYKNLVREANNEFLKNSDDLIKAAKNDLYKMDNKTSVAGNSEQPQIQASDEIEIIKDILKSENLSNSLDENFGSVLEERAYLDKQREAAVIKYLKANGIEKPRTMSDRDFLIESFQNQETRKLIESSISSFERDYEAAAQPLRNIISAQLSNAFVGAYSDVDTETQGIITNLVNNISPEKLKNISSGGEKGLSNYVDTILKDFDKLKKDGGINTIKTAFELETEFNNGELTFGEYKEKIDELEKFIDNSGLNEEVKTQLKISLNVDEVQKQYDDLVNRLVANVDDGDIFEKTEIAKNLVKGLSQSELKVAVDLAASGEIDLSKMSVEEIRDRVQKDARLIEAMSFKINVSEEAEGIEKLNTAMKESVSAAGLTSESLEALKLRYAELDSYDPAKLFERTSQGIHLNTKELNELEKELADTKLDNINDSLDTVMEAYADVTEKIRTCSDETERQSLIAEQLSYADKIEELSQLQAQYEGLTSAYNKWTQAQEAGEEGDIYDDVISKLESAAELKEKGLVGTNEFAAAVEFMTGKDTSSMTVDEIVEAYDNALPKMQRYFTEGSEGVENMLKDLNKMNSEWAHLNDNGEWELDIPIEEAAKKLGVSVDALEAVLGKGSDYGLEINYDSVFEASESLETLRTKAESANEALKKSGKTDLTFSFESTNAQDLENQIANATKMAEQFKNTDGTWNMKIEGAKEAQQIIGTLIMQKQEVTKPDFMKVSVATIGDEKLGNVINSMQQIQTYKNLYEIQVAIGADTSETETKIGEVVGKIQSLKTENPEVFASLGLDTTEFNTALETLNANVTANMELDQNALTALQTSLNSINADVLANVGLGDTSALDGMSGTASITPVPTTTDLGDGFTGIAKVTPNPTKTDFGEVFTGSAKITPSLTQTEFEVTVKKKNEDGTPYVGGSNGTANAGSFTFVNGSAFADGTTGKAFRQGDWGTKDSGVALGGELGQELVVRDGRWFTIGDNGAEFFRYKKNDIIFNAGQTKQLFEQGKIVGGRTRGMTANANGTAFAEGNAFVVTPPRKVSGGGTLYGSYYTPSSSSSSKSKSKSKSGSSSADDFKETIDWIEVAIERIERKISNLDKKASNVYKSWSSRNKNLVKEIDEINNEIDLQKQARDYYKKSADKFKLDKEYKKKVKDGTIQIEDITDKDLAEDIKTYKELWEKYLAAKDEIEALKETEHAKYTEIFDNVASDYEGLITLQEHYKNIIEESISQQEAQGHIVSATYYENLVNYEKSNQKKLLDERSNLVAAYNEAIANGLSKSSETARNMRAKINEVTQAIYESKTAVLEYQKAMREVKLESFELIQSQISQITQEADFLIELMSNDKLYDDKGQLTNKGNATRGLHVQNYGTYMQQASLYTSQIAELDTIFAGNKDSKDYVDAYNNLIKSRQDAILSAEKEKDAIKDMVEEGINLELDSLQKLIDKKQEALDSQKD